MLTLICGLPNAGKTTYSEKYENVVHFDDHRNNYARCDAMASRVQGNVCVEGVYNSAEQRKRLLKACGHHDRKVCIWLDTSVEECVKREHNYRRRPLGMVYAHHQGFEPPTYDEGWDEIRIIKGDESYEHR